MRVLKTSTSFLALCLTTACSQPPPEPPSKTVFDPMTRQIERASAVQSTVDDQADAARRAVDAQERGDTPR